MGRSPCCDKDGVKKGHWTPEEDIILVSYIQQHGPGNWRSVPTNTGLKRCSKSCRLRWTNYLRPGIKRGNFTPHEEGMIIHLQASLGRKWAAIASYLPQRTDNDIKNYWNTHLKKKLKKFQLAFGQYHSDEGATTTTPSDPIAATPSLESLAKINGFSNSGDRDKCSESNMELTNTTTHYVWSTENISRLLEGWMRSSTPMMIKESKREKPHKADDHHGDDDHDKAPIVEEKGHDLVIYDEEFESILSFENLNTMSGSSSSRGNDVDGNGNQTMNVVGKKQQRNLLLADHSSEGDPSLMILDKWLLDETISASTQVEEIMALPPPM